MSSYNILGGIFITLCKNQRTIIVISYFFPQDSDTDIIMFQGYKLIGTGVGKRFNRNPCRKVLLTNNPRNLTTQSPVGKGDGLGSVIKDRFGRLKLPPD